MTARIRIGTWTASPTLNLLENGTRSIRIEPRAMDVLVFLAGHAGKVVSIEELLASVWNGVVVGEGSVYLAIRQLRQVLDDPAGGSRYVENIPKRGYRLTVPVAYLEPEPALAPAPELTPRPAAPPKVTRTRVGRPPWWGLGAVLAVAAVLVATIAFGLRDRAQRVPENSVAVLPFENLSSDPEQEYFADGITLELLDALSRVRDLKVTGRTSSFHFKDSKEDPHIVGAALGVDHILEGSVRKAGEQVRVTARLSNARTGQQLWSATYTRVVDDIFQIQDEIARSVANALQVKLAVGDMARVPGMTRNVAAYDEYLRGMSLNLEWQPESFARASVHLQRAVALDPSFSLAWSGLNAVYTNGALLTPSRAEEWRVKASGALDRARALTPDAPHVLLERGIGESRAGKWLAAASTFEQLQASYARYGMANQAWGPRGVFLLGVGRVREAIPVLERARAEEPLAPAFAGFLSDAELASGDFAAALAEVDRGLALEGLDRSLLATGLIIALTQKDRSEIEKRLAAMPDGVADLRVLRGMTQFMAGRAGADDEIRRLAATASHGEKIALAEWAAYYHEPALALELLTAAAPNMAHPAMLWQPVMRDVRRLPAFKVLVRDLGFVDYWRKHGWADFCRPLREDDFTCE
jgi:TolB-like protein/DNA-binding winged helix-turn-helix (wHTH) protein/tetratricopeptide (TPR) repeat protein